MLTNLSFKYSETLITVIKNDRLKPGHPQIILSTSTFDVKRY